jgi:hypothetical protein
MTTKYDVFSALGEWLFTAPLPLLGRFLGCQPPALDRIVIEAERLEGCTLHFNGRAPLGFGYTQVIIRRSLEQSKQSW